MDFSEYLTVQNTIAVTGAVSGIIGVLFGYRERKLANESKKVDILDKVQEYLKDDLEQVHKVNDILKWRIDDLEKELIKYRNETRTK